MNGFSWTGGNMGLPSYRTQKDLPAESYCKHHRGGIWGQEKDFRKQAAGCSVLVLMLGTNPTPPKLDKSFPRSQEPSPLSEPWGHSHGFQCVKTPWEAAETVFLLLLLLPKS